MTSGRYTLAVTVNARGFASFPRSAGGFKVPERSLANNTSYTLLAIQRLTEDTGDSDEGDVTYRVSVLHEEMDQAREYAQEHNLAAPTFTAPSIVPVQRR